MKFAPLACFSLSQSIFFGSFARKACRSALPSALISFCLVTFFLSFPFENFGDVGINLVQVIFVIHVNKRCEKTFRLVAFALPTSNSEK
jgi:hypothetical protein